ncbi:hypothetical protein EIP91_010265 [Steccherinum ochraceum]|uniref:F-box domain-containing protein n=1 Tax=Steccherinum ochraceum TaxID=92696 RepID=A0A4R0RJ23_9APHY|nr:hypothetical protein EIP91_010265 [Steccherinum ochraceum]
MDTQECNPQASAHPATSLPVPMLAAMQAPLPIASFNTPLPPEVFDNIIDQLDFKNLKKLSVVSKSWLYSTRRHIFHHIRLHTYHNEEDNRTASTHDLPTFVIMLQGSPQISPYLQHLHLSGLIFLTSLVRAVEMLVQLKTLTLGGVEINHKSNTPLPEPASKSRTLKKLVMSSIRLRNFPSAWSVKLVILSMFSSVSQLHVAGTCLADHDHSWIEHSIPDASRLIDAIGYRNFSNSMFTSPVEGACVDILMHSLELSNTNTEEGGTLCIPAWPFFSCAEIRNTNIYDGLWACLPPNRVRTLEFMLNIDVPPSLIVRILFKCRDLPSLKTVVFRYPRRAGDVAGSVEVLEALGKVKALRKIVVDMGYWDNWVPAFAQDMHHAFKEVSRGSKQCEVEILHCGERVDRKSWKSVVPKPLDTDYHDMMPGVFGRTVAF